MISERLCLIGVGLIGGSLARSLRSRGLAGSVVGVGRRSSQLQLAVELGVIDDYTHNAAQAVAGADMIVIATPMCAMANILDGIADHLSDQCVISDVGSVKQALIDTARSSLNDRFGQFVAAHPVAGTEHSGVEASFDGLFAGRPVILTPTPETTANAIQRVTDMWQSVGAEVNVMTPEHHDRVLARTSHLPHLLAYGLVDLLASLPDSDEHFQLAAGGFRDFTRIASSDPVMWRDICATNTSALSDAIIRYRNQLDTMLACLDGGDWNALCEIFDRAKQARDHYLPGQGEGAATETAGRTPAEPNH